MANRNEWKFTLSADELLVAATGRRDYHASRLEHWKSREIVSEAELKESGLRIREAAAPGSTSNSYRGQPVWDNEKLTAFDEAQNKVREHQSKLDDFTRWMQALQRDPGQRFEATIDDLAYFGL